MHRGAVLLAIDVGNTQTLAGVYQGQTLLHEWRLSTDRSATVDELAAAHDQIMRLRGGSLDELEAVIVSSVVPSQTAAYLELSEKYLGKPAVVVGPGIKTGMPLLIDNPRELGADRLVNAVAAYHAYGGPCIVIDFGTATNLDIVSASGEYLGGIIAPGVHTSLEALAARAARLVAVDLVAPERLIGRSTVEAMRSGLVMGTVAMVDGLVARLRDDVGEDAAVIATGGLARLVTSLSDEISNYEPLLTLEGLRLVYQMNVSVGGR